jgi:hypothetical protein
MPSIVRRDSATAGSISKLAVTRVQDNLLVTAVRDDAGKLKVIVWKADGPTIVRKDDHVGDAITDVAITRLGHERVVTASRKSDGTLQLIAWEVTPSGDISKFDTAKAGEVGEVAVQGLTTNLVATAVTDAAGDLKIISWMVPDFGQIQRSDSKSAGGVSLVATAQWYSGHMVTAVRDSNGNLEIIYWHVADNGQIERMGSAGAGGVSRIAVIKEEGSFSLSEAEFITAVRDKSHDLKMIAWKVSANGDVERLGDYTAGEISRVSMTYLGSGRTTVAVKDASGNLKIINFMWRWVQDPNNPTVLHQEFVRMEDASAGAISEVGVASVETSGYYFATAVRNGSDNLEVILWQLVD